MNWCNPKENLPTDNQMVWVMLEPHKNRGRLLDSSPSIEIVCGWTSHDNDGSCRVENEDELGLGNISWYLVSKGKSYSEYNAIAWLPVNEMVLPRWIK